MGNGWALRGVCVEGVVDLPTYVKGVAVTHAVIPVF